MADLYPDRPPDAVNPIRVLARHRVRYVVTGSYALMLYGVAREPGDLDMVPDTEPENLRRLVRVLDEIEARPPGPFGHWEMLESGEWKWFARETSPEEIESWQPDVGDVDSLDHSYCSRHGNFDVVPRVNGTYAELRPRAVEVTVYGHRIRIAHVDDLLARPTVPRRAKGVDRVRELRRIQRERGLHDE
jgi:hypothetical protein